MELRQLTYFEAVARRGSFTRAAQEVNVAQPAVSAQLRGLERELGLPLLERTTRSVRLTRAGELALPRARAILTAVADLRAELQALLEVEPGRVRLGAATALGPLDLPALLAAFHRDHPAVRLAVRTGFMPDLVDAVAAGALDAAVGPLTEQLPPQFAVAILAEESVVLIVPSHGYDHLDQERVRLAAVSAEPFVCLPQGSGLHTLLREACRAAGFEPSVLVEAPDPRTLRAYVAAGLGVGLIPRSEATQIGPPVRVHELQPAPPHPPIGLVRASAAPASGATSALLASLRAHAAPG